MSVERKNILLLITNLDFGGAQTSFSKLSLELGKVHNVVNVVFNKNLAADYPYGGPLLDLDVPAGTSLFGKLVSFFSRVKRLKRIKKEHRIDVSISFLEGADYVNIFSGTGEKKIISVRGSKKFDQNITGLLGWVRHTWLIPGLYKRADQIVAVNEGIRKELNAEYGIKNPIHVIYNFYDQQTLKQAAGESDVKFQSWADTHQVICIVGRLAIEKGINQFLVVFGALKPKFPNLKLLLIGDGPIREELKKQVKNSGMSISNSFDHDAEVVFAGYQTNPHKYICKCLWLVLPSLHEGFPNILVEAMSLGVPVIAADCPYGPREILTNEHGQLAGELLPVLNSEQAQKTWEEKMTTVLLDKTIHKNFITLGSARAASFSENKSVHQWLDIIAAV